MAGQLARGRGRGTPYNPLVSDVMERVYGPTAGEDRPHLDGRHPRSLLSHDCEAEQGEDQDGRAADCRPTMPRC